MSPCCGRPDNRANKEGAAGYYQKYAYLSSHQRDQAEKLSALAGKCDACDALTMSNGEGNCTICGNPKKSKDNNNE